MISSILNTFLQLRDPIVNNWMARIYTSLPIDSMLSCMVECELDLDCKLFTIQDGLCRLGNGLTFNTSVPPMANHLEGVYVDKGTFECIVHLKTKEMQYIMTEIIDFRDCQ